MVLFLPSIVLNLVTDMNIFVCISLMGGISLIYTLIGGIEAVIWTDVVVQVFVLMAGVTVSLLIIVLDTELGFIGIVETAQLEKKI